MAMFWGKWQEGNELLEGYRIVEGVEESHDTGFWSPAPAQAPRHWKLRPESQEAEHLC